MFSGLAAMELKVWVDGIQRVVCGVSEQTTCQEVVIALAQAIGEFLSTDGPAGAPAWAWPSGPHLDPGRVGAAAGSSCLPQLLEPDGLKVRDVG